MQSILIVDDDQTMTSLLSTLLEMDGYQVKQAGGADEVWSQLRSDPPDLVLMDVFLSDADGLEILGKIRADWPADKLPVIMSSGMDFSEQCKAAQANDFLLKPYAPEQLTEMIRRNLSGDGDERPPANE